MLKDIYENILRTLKQAEAEQRTEAVTALVTNGDFDEVVPVDDRFLWAWVIHRGSEAVLLQYRYYDTSKAFSIQPDMNVYLLKWIDSEVLARWDEIRFLDNSAY